MEMRNINEIITELKNHPNYITSEIFVWDDYLEVINENLEDMEYDEENEKEFIPLVLEDLNYELKEKIRDNISVAITYGYEVGLNPYSTIVRNHDTGEIEIEN
jgi:hypothetical protein